MARTPSSTHHMDSHGDTGLRARCRAVAHTRRVDVVDMPIGAPEARGARVTPME